MKFTEYIKFPRAKVDELTSTLSEFLASGQPCEFANDVYAVYHNTLAGELIYNADDYFLKPTVTTQPNLDNLIIQKKEEKTTDFKAAKPTPKEEKKEMPPKYSDGSFRDKRNGKEYRFMHDGKQISVCGKTEEICFDKRTNIIAGKAKKTPIKTQVTYADWLKHWFDTYKIPHLGKESAERSLGLIRKYIVPKLGKTLITKLNHDNIQIFINEFISMPNSQKKIFDIVHGSLEKARIIGKIKLNPADGIELKLYTKKAKRPLQINEQLAVCESIKKEKYLKLFLFCCCTGIRIGRVLSLTNKDIDFEKNEIIVFMKQKKGLEETYRVPFLPELLEGLPLTGKLFGNIQKAAARSFFDGLFTRLKIEDVSMHSFRHTFVSMLNFIEVPLKQAQVWAGHKTFSITADVYTHIIKNNGTSPILEYLRRLKETNNI